MKKKKRTAKVRKLSCGLFKMSNGKYHMDEIDQYGKRIRKSWRLFEVARGNTRRSCRT